MKRAAGDAQEGFDGAKQPRLEPEWSAAQLNDHGLTDDEERQLTALYRKQEAIFQHHLVIRQRMLRDQLLGGVPSQNDLRVLHTIEADNKETNEKIEALETRGKERTAQVKVSNINNNPAGAP